MPKLTPASEQAVRLRITEAALRVFAERGYHGATIADVVRESGLSVGAIYTHFKGKDDLFLSSCDLSLGQGLGEMAARIVRGTSTAEKLAIASGFFIDGLTADAPDMASAMVGQWARAETEPGVRAMLVRRRQQSVAAGEMLVAEGVARGELPPWVDVHALAAAYVTFLDGLLLWRIEEGASYRREEAERRAVALLRPILAAAATAAPPEIPAVPAQPWSFVGPARE